MNEAEEEDVVKEVTFRMWGRLALLFGVGVVIGLIGLFLRGT